MKGQAMTITPAAQSAAVTVRSHDGNLAVLIRGTRKPAMYAVVSTLQLPD